MGDPKYYDTTLLGIKVHFPYPEMYRPQKALIANALRAFLQNENALLESPTGTGKTLALLASSLSFVSNPSAWSTNSENSKSSEQVEPSSAPKIWYTTRTHTQLSQLISELKKLPYRPQMAILASRKHTCINSEVRRNYDDMNTGCHEEHNVLHRCPYGNRSNLIPHQFQSTGENSIFTLEDLSEYCRENIKCPYLISREMIKSADLIFSPYNYILDEDIRRQMDITLTNSLLIIDEAHNLEDACREVASFTLNYEQINIWFSFFNMPTFQQLIEETLSFLSNPFMIINSLITKIQEYFESKRRECESSHLKSKADYFVEGDTKTVLEQRFGLDPVSWAAISDAIDQICSAASKDNNTEKDRAIPGYIVTFIRNLGRIGYIFSYNGNSIEDFRIVFNYDKSVSGASSNSDTLHFLCLYPGVSFQAFAREASSVILASGTLSPMGSFSGELGMNFAHKVSAPHVIDSSQVQCHVIEKIDGIPISSAKNFLSDTLYEKIGEAILEILPSIPDGALFFLPSFKIMNALIEAWKHYRRPNNKSTLFEELYEVKPIFIEEKGKNVYKFYLKSISQGNGGLLMGVCRGTLSEGLDFNNEQARAVFIFGIPYPALYDASVAEKRRFNDSALNRHPKMFNGKDWYDAQALRPLAQAVGRCIRHSNDYGAIILIDQRFPQKLKDMLLPNWVIQAYNNSGKKPETPNEINRELKDFFADMKVKHPSVMYKDPEIAPDAGSSITCRDCFAELIEKARFEPDAVSVNQMKSVAEMLKKEDVRLLKLSQGELGPHTAEGEIVWSQMEELGYRTLNCKRCGKMFGFEIDATSKKNQKRMGEIYVNIDVCNVRQGKISVELDKIVKTPLKLTIEKPLGKGQSLLCFKKSSKDDEEIS